MARYYFNLHECGVVTEDCEGMELPDVTLATITAIQAARDVMAGEVKDGSLCVSCKIIVLDEDHGQVAEVPFREALSISGL